MNRSKCFLIVFTIDEMLACFISLHVAHKANQFSIEYVRSKFYIPPLPLRVSIASYRNCVIHTRLHSRDSGIETADYTNTNYYVERSTYFTGKSCQYRAPFRTLCYYVSCNCNLLRECGWNC